jgi:hypothetical protein
MESIRGVTDMPPGEAGLQQRLPSAEDRGSGAELGRIVVSLASCDVLTDLHSRRDHKPGPREDVEDLPWLDPLLLQLAQRPARAPHDADTPCVRDHP